jgi:hypothetical protein
VTEAQVHAAMEKRMSGQELSSAESAMLRQIFSQFHGHGGGRGGRGGPAEGGGQGSGGQGTGSSSGSFVVFVLQGGKPAARAIRTGLTDLDYIEVTSGLADGDTVLVLPSASLISSQAEMQQRVQRMTGGGGIPGMQQQTTTRSGGQGR